MAKQIRNFGTKAQEGKVPHTSSRSFGQSVSRGGAREARAMLRRRRRMAVLALLSFAAAAPAPAAQEAGEQSPVAAATKQITEQAALEEAQNKLTKQRIEALGLKSNATGKTELKENGGQFEGWLLSANAVQSAADRIATSLRTKIPHGQAAAILAGDEVLDLGLPGAMEARMRGLSRRATAALEAGCPAASSAQAEMVGVSSALVGAIPYVGAVIGALKTDTTISGLAGPTDARLLVNALAERVLEGDKWIVPGDIAKTDPAGSLWKLWEHLTDQRYQLAHCRAVVAGSAKKDDKTAQRHVAALDASIGEIDTFETKQVIGGDGPSALVKASRLEALAKVPVSIVRVYVEKAGGSTLQRSNLFTMLGAPAIGITGGSLVGFRITDATTGQAQGGGNLSCRTALTNMRAIHAGRVRASSCDWNSEKTASKGGAER